MKYIYVFVATGLIILFHSGLGRTALGPIVLKEGAVLPLSTHSTIRMESQNVTIRIGSTSYTVDAVFRFFNTGETVRQWVGIPQYVKDASFAFVFKPFEAWIDDRKVSFSTSDDYRASKPYSPPSGGGRWKIKEVTFSGHDETVIRLRYEAPLKHQGSGYYMYGNGSCWKDKMSKLILTIDHTAIPETKNFTAEIAGSPGPRRMSPSILRFEVNDVKPISKATLQFYCR